MTRWQYHVMKIETSGMLGGKLDADAFQAELDRLGADLWELVSCFDTNQLHGQSRDVVAVFKRPR